MPSGLAGVVEPKMLHGHTGAVASGVANPDAAETGPVPPRWSADTVNVYVVPFARLVSAFEVAGGLPVMVVVSAVWAAVPR